MRWSTSQRWMMGMLAVGWMPLGAQRLPSIGRPVPYTSLTASQRAAIEVGGAVQLLQSLPTSPWPRSIVFEFIDATPEECAAVLTDYDLQSTYTPRLKESHVVQRRSAVETDVAYVVDVPVFPDER